MRIALLLHVLTHQPGNAQGRLHQPQVLALHLQPAHRIIRHRLRKTGQLRKQPRPTLIQRDQGMGSFCHTGQRHQQCPHGLPHAMQAAAPRGLRQGLRCRTQPAQPRARGAATTHGTPFVDSVLQRTQQLHPVGQPSRMQCHIGQRIFDKAL